jgi:hypothetical protein
MLENYQIRFDLIFLNVRNIILKLHIKLIIRIEAWNNFIMYINMLLCMMDGYEP